MILDASIRDDNGGKGLDNVLKVILLRFLM